MDILQISDHDCVVMKFYPHDLLYLAAACHEGGQREVIEKSGDGNAADFAYEALGALLETAAFALGACESAEIRHPAQALTAWRRATYNRDLLPAYKVRDAEEEVAGAANGAAAPPPTKGEEASPVTDEGMLFLSRYRRLPPDAQAMINRILELGDPGAPSPAPAADGSGKVLVVAAQDPATNAYAFAPTLAVDVLRALELLPDVATEDLAAAYEALSKEQRKVVANITKLLRDKDAPALDSVEKQARETPPTEGGSGVELATAAAAGLVK